MYIEYKNPDAFMFRIFFQCMSNNRPTIVPAQLALAMMYELELNKLFQSEDKQQIFDEALSSATDVKKECHTLDEQRALLGCYHLMSMYVLPLWNITLMTLLIDNARLSF